VDLLDACALIAFLTGEPLATAVQGVLADGAAGIASVQAAEVVDVLSRRRGVAPGESRAAIEAIPGLALVPVPPAAAWRAGELRARHYHRKRCPISLADCLLVAVAGGGNRIATSDKPLQAVARAEGVGAIALSA
jgi:PIN domain nuclease of toxin-antitoxin system